MVETRRATPGDSLAGTLLADRYEVLSPLDEGGMASVYLARDTKLARKVVIKIPRKEFLVYEGFRERFAREVGSLARLQHPNIGRIQDLGEHEGVPFAVLDYLAGGDLKQAIDRAGGTVSAEQVVQWLPQIARALDFIHSKGTLHRDVKPQNILFDERGHVFLSDFGIATTLQTLGADATTLADAGQLTVVGGFVGTPNFAPPEAVHRQLTPAYDQYSLGVLVYLALSGSFPIRPRETMEAVLLAKAQEDPTPITDLVPDLPAALARVAMRSLARDPGQRFASCGAFAEAFVQAVASSRATPRPSRRGFWGWAAAAALAGIASLWWGSQQPGPTPSERLADLREPETTRREEARGQPTRQPLVPFPSPVPTIETSAEPSTEPSIGVKPEPSPRVEARASPSPRGSAAPTAEPSPEVAKAMARVEGMVAVPAGAFLSGCNQRVDSECDDDERSSTRRDVPSFWIDRTEVTVADYRRCVDAGRCTAPAAGEGCNWAVSGQGRHPVNCVDWAQAEAYCSFVGRRLPTEWEWEKAARGSDGRKYPWGSRGFERAGSVANIADASLEKERKGWALDAPYDDGAVQTAPVGTYPAGASPTGALDMIGNVWEWTSTPLDGDPGQRIIRGGSWADPASEARASFRIWSDTTHRRSAGGFRCAKSGE
jgi:formylglycine-generating enzyme required for sulfatase activity/tRNA A-37 threonylcarbamoyl transferase component Bud32